MQLTASNRFLISLGWNFQLIMQESFGIFLAFMRFLFVTDLPVARRNRNLIRGLFLFYLCPAFMILGPHAIVLMVIYQIGFNMLLRAALHK